MNDRQKLMRKIYDVDFAIHETVLYLDGHPTNAKALDFYKEAEAKRKELVAEYEEKYGPITVNAVNGDRWTWVEGDWPWQKGWEE